MTVEFSDGDISVWTANAADDQPLDADGRITISGGTVLAAGGSGGQRPDGMTPPGGAPSDGQLPQGQLPQSDGTTPPELPAASSN